MFTWICPQCGREVPPSYSECPTCAERRQQAAGGQAPAAAPPQQQPQYAPQAAPQPQYAPPVQPQYAPPAQQYPPQQQYAPPVQPPQYAPAPPPQYAPPAAQPVYTISEQKKGMPAWLVGILTIAVLGGALFGLYKFVGGHGTASNAAAAKTDATGASSKNPYAKYVEVVGLRILENDAKKPIVRFAVVNHSPAELTGLELRVLLNSVDAKAETEPLSVIQAKVGTVPANGTKDVEAPLNTKLKIYELPDWQFVKTTFEITAPN